VPPSTRAYAGQATGQHHRKRAERLIHAHDPFRQAGLPAPMTSSATNHVSSRSWTATALKQTCGLRAQGTDEPRRHAPAGQAARPANPSDAQTACPTEPPPAAGWGFAATIMPVTAPAIRISRPASPAGRNAIPVTT
jgi:hypothetical protein